MNTRLLHALNDPVKSMFGQEIVFSKRINAHICYSTKLDIANEHDRRSERTSERLLRHQVREKINYLTDTVEAYIFLRIWGCPTVFLFLRSSSFAISRHTTRQNLRCQDTLDTKGFTPLLTRDVVTCLSALIVRLQFLYLN